MVNKSVVFFLGLCPVIPLVAHFAEGLIFIAEFWLLLAVGIVSKMLIAYFKIDNDENRFLRLQVVILSYIQDKSQIFCFFVKVLANSPAFLYSKRQYLVF